MNFVHSFIHFLDHLSREIFALQSGIVHSAAENGGCLGGFPRIGPSMVWQFGHNAMVE